MKKDYKSYVAIASIWYRRYMECSDLIGYDDLFTKAVWKFYWSLLDVDEDDKAIKTKVDKYLNDEWRPSLHIAIADSMKQDHISPNDKTNYRLYYRLNENDLIKYLFTKIIQTIQDSGIGFQINPEMQDFLISQD